MGARITQVKNRHSADTLAVESRTVEFLVADRLPCRLLQLYDMPWAACPAHFSDTEMQGRGTRWEIPRHGTIRILGPTLDIRSRRSTMF